MLRAAREPESMDGRAKVGAISVLLVEPDPQAAQLILLLLAAPDETRLKFEVVRVEDVEEGLRIIDRAEPADVVLLGQPPAGGRLLADLRSLRRRAPDLPVVAMAEPGAEARVSAAVAAGAEAFQVRGRDSRALKGALALAVARRELRTLDAAPVPAREPRLSAA